MRVFSSAFSLMQCIMDYELKFLCRYKPDTNPKNRKITTRVSHSVEQVHQEYFKNRLIVSTLTGDLALLSLDIIDPVPDSKMPRGKVENVSSCCHFM